MKLAMAQIALYDDMDKNLEKAISFIKQAQECNLIFLSEIQLSPFFPQYEKYDAPKYLIVPDSGYIKATPHKDCGTDTQSDFSSDCPNLPQEY